MSMQCVPYSYQPKPKLNHILKPDVTERRVFLFKEIRQTGTS